ncbi:hypothetical protein GCM10022244_31220 [Streptomyces gulbargensis]|uniref:Uncharacterized protein n=1 Tax=Streptomyces gulbargensis TaxID=364901 RepID=A0ABP7MDP6_9ACTN
MGAGCSYGLVRGVQSGVYGPESYDAEAFGVVRRSGRVRVPEDPGEAVSGAAARWSRGAGGGFPPALGGCRAKRLRPRRYDRSVE